MIINIHQHLFLYLGNLSSYTNYTTIFQAAGIITGAKGILLQSPFLPGKEVLRGDSSDHQNLHFIRNRTVSLKPGSRRDSPSHQVLHPLDVLSHRFFGSPTRYHCRNWRNLCRMDTYMGIIIGGGNRLGEYERGSGSPFHTMVSECNIRQKNYLLVSPQYLTNFT